jgi:hypothetical protein
MGHHSKPPELPLWKTAIAVLLLLIAGGAAGWGVRGFFLGVTRASLPSVVVTTPRMYHPAPVITPAARTEPLKTYTVQPGDTLSAIAVHYHTTWEHLWQINKSKVPDPDVMFSGLTLTLSGS